MANQKLTNRDTERERANMKWTDFISKLPFSCRELDLFVENSLNCDVTEGRLMSAVTGGFFGIYNNSFRYSYFF